jgi:hypothetical protein
LYTYNPEKAKSFWLKPVTPMVLPSRLRSRCSQEGLDIAAMVVSYLAKIGVKMDLKYWTIPPSSAG